jgi:hypothetical protein
VDSKDAIEEGFVPYPYTFPAIRFTVQEDDRMTYTQTDTGCYFDCARGTYIGEAVQQLAASHGWKYSAQWEMVYQDDTDGEEYTWAWDEAEEFLNGLTDDGVWFGATENGDWGLWPVVDEDEDEYTKEMWAAQKARVKD